MVVVCDTCMIRFTTSGGGSICGDSGTTVVLPLLFIVTWKPPTFTMGPEWGPMPMFGGKGNGMGLPMKPSKVGNPGGASETDIYKFIPHGTNTSCNFSAPPDGAAGCGGGL